MDENKIRQIIQEEIARAAQQAQYTVTRVPVHTHNNIDAPNLPQHNVQGFYALDGNPVGTNVVPGVANPVFLDGQTIVQGNTQVSTVDDPFVGQQQFVSNLYTYPLPIIYGYGTTTSLTLTGSPVVGATSATLTGNWAGTTGVYAVQFFNGEVRLATLTNGSTAVTWTQGLLYNTGGAGLTEIGNARFHGGMATAGTAIIFRNDDDGVLQLWVRTNPGTFIETWASVDLTLSIPD